MTIETNLLVEFEKQRYFLEVKLIRIESVNHFFIKDIGEKNSLLKGNTLEFSCTDSFYFTQSEEMTAGNVANTIIDAVQKV